MAAKDPSGAAARELSKLPAEEYLNRTKATAAMQDAVNLVLEYRPEQPLVFLARYFQMMCGDLQPVEVSAHYIQSCGNFYNTSFEDNIVLAYHALKKEKGNEPVDCSSFQQLLSLLCDDVASPSSDKLVHHLSAGSAVIGYAKFKHGVEACLLYGELASVCEDLFLSVDTANAGHVKTSVLLSALDIANSKTPTPNVELFVAIRSQFERHHADGIITLAQLLDLLVPICLPLNT